MARTARGETASAAATGNSRTRAAAAPVVRFQARWVSFTRAGAWAGVAAFCKLLLVFLWVGREAMALSFAVKCAFSAFACTVHVHRVCARSACLLQRTQ